jgi:methylisocitrate lyase
MKGTTQLRNILKEPGMLVAPGCVDAISGLINKHVGFKAVYVTGSGTEAAMMGNPDIGLKTLTEIATHAGHIADATGIPVICDAEAGFGSYVNMVRTVREFEKAGVAAIHVEDQVTPPNSPSVKDRTLLPRNQALGMVKAALDARTDPDFVIIARSDGDEISIDELIERCNLYLEAGADLAMPQIWKIDGQPWTDLPAEKVVETHRRVCKEINGPLLGLVVPEEVTITEIESLGYKIYIYPSDSHQAAVAAMFEVMRELKDKGTTRGYFDRHPRIDSKLYQEMLRTPEWLELERKYKP